MKRRAPSANGNSQIAEYLKYYRPEGGMMARLFAEDETSYPPTGAPPVAIFPICIPPQVPAGRYRLQYYDKDGQEVSSLSDRDPWIEVNGQGYAHRSPAELVEEEDIRNQRIERREIFNRRMAAQATMLENAALTTEKLAQTLTEANERQSRTLAETHERYQAQSSEREKAILDVLKNVMGVVQEHSRSAGQSNEQQTRMMEHLVDKAREHTDWAGVAKEVIAQLGGLAQTMVTAPREGAILDGEIRATRGKPAAALQPDSAHRLPAHREDPKIKKESSPAPPASAARTAGSVPVEVPETKSESHGNRAGMPNPSAGGDTRDEIARFEQFFGFSAPIALNDTNSANPEAPSESESECAVEDPREMSDQPSACLAAAPEAPRPADLAAFMELLQSMRRPPSMAEGTTGDRDGAPALTAGAEAGGALVPVDFMELLTQLSAANMPAAPPRPKQWSRDWAIDEMKRRFLSLGDVGFVLTATQPRRLLRFLQEMIAAVSPPTLAGAEA